jgi:hypothetical protein
MSKSYRDRNRFVSKMETSSAKPKHDKKEVTRAKEKRMTLDEVKALFGIEDD